ncbi:MAG TPA: hypothetical protein VFZ53_09335 [Polyangiaceae bacterium]
MKFRRAELLLFATVAASAGQLAACSDDPSNGGDAGGSGGSGAAGVGGTGASTFNQCGVAAPLPADTGQCTVVSVPLLADFDDYSGTVASDYTFYVNGPPPAEGALLGGFLHVDDGSAATEDTSVVSTEMVAGEGDAGYALWIANTNAVTWGGLLMVYFPFGGATATCLNAAGYEGLEFSIKGSSPSGRFGVSIGMLDTTPTADHGLCTNPNTSDCKPASLELTLPPDAETWKAVRVPWSALTPGVGSDTSCVPVTGQNVLRLVIQPFMSYPPPDYVFEPGSYAIAVDNLRFY